MTVLFVSPCNKHLLLPQFDTEPSRESRQ